MSVGTDPRYRSLAAIAAGEIGAPASGEVLIAITAQWQCEQPANRWPPVHNNPGFVTSGAMHSVGEAAAAATSAPGVGFLAQYPTPEAGARAYGRLIAKGQRYQPARKALIAGRGGDYLSLVTRAGYGTGTVCSLNAYKHNGGGQGIESGGTAKPPPAGKPPPASSPPAAGGGVVQAIYPVMPVGAKVCPNGVTIIVPGPLGKNQSAIPIPVESIGDMGGCTRCADGYVPGVVAGMAIGPVTGPVPFGFVDPAQLPPGTPNACIRSDLHVGDSVGGSNAAGVAGDVAAAAAAAVGAALTGLAGALAPLLFLFLFLVMILLGLYVVATSRES